MYLCVEYLRVTDTATMQQEIQELKRRNEVLEEQGNCNKNIVICA